MISEDRSIVFVDLETCPIHSEVLEVCVVAEDGTVLLHSIVADPQGSHEVNFRKGLTSDIVALGQPRDLIEQALQNIFSESIVISWNLRFDRRYFARAFAYASEKVCAMERYSPYHGNFVIQYNGYHRIGLEKAMRHLGFEYEGRPHRSLSDAQALRLVWQWMEKNPIRHPVEIEKPSVVWAAEKF